MWTDQLHMQLIAAHQLHPFFCRLLATPPFNQLPPNVLSLLSALFLLVSLSEEAGQG